MATCSLLFDTPIPRGAIQLGQLILDPKYPTEDACRPSLLSTPPAAPAATPADPRPPSAHVVTSTFTDFKQTLDRTRSTRLGLALADIVSLTPSTSASTSTTLSAPLLVSQELADAPGYFHAACREPPVRAWLERHLRRPLSRVYLVSGLRTLTGAWVDVGRKRDVELGVEVSAPVWLVSAAAAGVPLPVDGDLGSASVAVENGRGNTVGYAAPDEYVFAVAYRRVQCSLFSMRDVNEAWVQRGNRWKSTVALRGEEADGVDVHLAGQLEPEEFLGGYEAVDLDGENILCEVEEHDPER